MAKTIGEKINKSWDLVREFAPNLLLIRATLRPFEDVIISETAGPQHPKGDEDESPFFEVEVRDPSADGATVLFRFEGDAASVKVKHLWYEDGVACDMGDDHTTTLTGVYDFLRQLPRPSGSFRRRAGK